MLVEFGVPLSPIEARGIELQSTVLPAIAPVLQRFCIEVKQTFRFGLSGEEAPRNLILCGPGAAIPNICKAFSKQLDMHIDLDPICKDATPLTSFGRGTLECSIVESQQCPDGLLPEIAYDSRTSRVLAKSLFAGALLAFLVMGGEYVRTTLDSQQVSHQISQDAPKLKVVNQFNKKIESAKTMSSIISDVSGLVTKTVESIPQWELLLANIPSVLNDSLRINEIHGEFTQGIPNVEISGVAVASSEKGSGQALNMFVKSIESIEGIESVTLGATSRVSVGDNQWGRKFKMNVTLEHNPLPYQAFVKNDNFAPGKVVP